MMKVEAQPAEGTFLDHGTAACDTAAHEPDAPEPKSPSGSGTAEATVLAEAEVLTDVWSTPETAPAEGDFGPVKVCRNARGFSFDGLAGNGDEDDSDDIDLGEAWRRRLISEGKASPESETLRHLVLGPPADD